MKNELHNNLTPPRESLTVLVAYDTLRSAIKAKALCDRLTQQITPACGLTLGYWSLSAMQQPSLAQAVDNEAASAELLIVAVNGDECLETPVKRSLVRCIRRVRAHGGALVAQLYGILKMDEELSPTYGCLKQLAQELGVDFFSEVLEPVESDFEAWIKTIHQGADMKTPLLDRIF